MSRPDDRDLGVKAMLDPFVARWAPPGDPASAVTRGRRRRAFRASAAALTVAVFVGAVAWAATTMGRDVQSVTSTEPRLVGDREYFHADDVTTLVDHGDGFEIAFPAGWTAAEGRINDWVSSPREILALATYPLRPGGEAVTDGQVPSNAMDDLGPDDAFIWVNDGGDGGDRLPARPSVFGPMMVCVDGSALCPDPEGRALGIQGVRAWWMYFGDGGRTVYVFVAMGEERFRDPGGSRAVWDVLDSLRIEPF
ncbi:MAG TPA: hypothetical protein VE032_09395 [Actinomycetota bacterium]|nr:hypothetical protein [Actinomycetota bacterium]